MFFRERTYSVLIVSASEKFNAAILPLLPISDYGPTVFVSSAAEARRRLLDQGYDLVLINTPLADDFGMRLAIDICGRSDAGVLLLVRGECFSDISARASEFGVMTLEKPVSTQLLTQVLRLLCATRERLRKMGERQASVEEKIAEIRLVNRAKWALIQHQGMTEADAHRHIEKQAMDLRLSKREVAEGILKAYG